ncbi:MAG: HAD-IA family hydrolase [Idiomarina sp.]|nr:HAD-IA family hydrolase [Idiomarina sp.]
MSELNRPAAILFDLDGTLLDTAPDLHRALNQVLQRYRKPLIELDVARPVASHGSTGLLTLGFGDEFNDDSRNELREAFLSAYAEDPYSGTTYFAGIESLLETLQSLQIPYGIVTNKPTQFTHALLPEFPLLAASAVVVCGDTLKVAKPDPAPLLYAAESLQLKPQACWYVGDAERDIEAGRAAGMHTILASYGYISDVDRPHLWQADATVDDVHALTRYLTTILP